MQFKEIADVLDDEPENAKRQSNQPPRKQNDVIASLNYATLAYAIPHFFSFPQFFIFIICRDRTRIKLKMKK
jgi:hypothetical protein